MPPQDSYADPLLLAVRKTLDFLRQPAADADDDVHRHRVATKRLRSYLRLLKPSLPREDYIALNRKLRDAARVLAQSRDHTVVARTVKQLGGSKYQKLLPQEVPETNRKSKETDSVLKEIEACVNVLLKLVDEREKPSEWADAMVRSYRRAKQAWKKCSKKNADAESFHEWRKDVKYLHLQLDAMHASSVPACLRYRERLIRLEQLLGLHHDYTLVLQRCAMTNDKKSAKLAVATRREQNRLARRCLKRGETCFKHMPVKFSSKWLTPLLGID